MTASQSFKPTGSAVYSIPKSGLPAGGHRPTGYLNRYNALNDGGFRSSKMLINCFNKDYNKLYFKKGKI